MTEQMEPNWVLVHRDQNALAGDEVFPKFLIAYTKQKLAEYGRLLCKQKNDYIVQFMPPDLLQQIVTNEPQVEGIALVTHMGPLVPYKGSRAREITKAYIKRAAFLSMQFGGSPCAKQTT